jgi:hypothetical protein
MNSTAGAGSSRYGVTVPTDVMPGPDEASLRRVMEVCVGVVEQLRSRREEIAEAIRSAIRHQVPKSLDCDDDSTSGEIRTTAFALLDFCLEAIERGPHWHLVPPPSTTGAHVRSAARNGVGLGTVMRCCVAGHGALAVFIDEEVEAIAAMETGPIRRSLRRAQEALLIHLTTSAEREYSEEIAGAGRVERLLAGGVVSRHDLSYEIDGRWHLGVVADSSAGDRTLQNLGLHLDRSVWTVLSSEATLWAWLGGEEPLTSAEFERAVRARATPGLRMAVGEPGRGLGGWRMTHRQAREALRVACHQRETLTRFADVALVALLQDSAKDLIDLYLSPLDTHREPRLMRETLRAYFRAGQNASCAGSAVGSDRRVVHNRLRWVENALGRRISTIAAELDVALRLEQLLSESSQDH